MTENTADTEAAIVATVLDYFDGWFDGDVDRMTRALHSELAKRALVGEPSGLDETTAAEMIDLTGKGVGKARDPGDRKIVVEVEDVYGVIANATVRSAVYREYVQLVRTAEGWKIINALWAMTETGEAEPDQPAVGSLT